MKRKGVKVQLETQKELERIDTTTGKKLDGNWKGTRKGAGKTHATGTLFERSLKNTRKEVDRHWKTTIERLSRGTGMVWY